VLQSSFLPPKQIALTFSRICYRVIQTALLTNSKYLQNNLQSLVVQVVKWSWPRFR
jgi:hypothetical protein